MDQNRMQQRARRTPAPQVRITDEEMSYEGEFDGAWPPRVQGGMRRYQSTPDVRAETGRRPVDAQPVPTHRQYAHTTIPPRRSSTQTGIPAVQGNRQRIVYTDDVAPQNNKRRLRTRQKLQFHWLVFVGIAMFIMIIGWVMFSALGNWWQVTLDDWHYGRPRTFQIDAVVGHHDSPNNPSHFIAINLNRHVIIIELPGGDATKAQIYSGPILIGQGQDLTPVTLSFQDVNGDGKPDMVVTVQDSHFVFINENGGFRPARPGEGG